MDESVEVRYICNAHHHRVNIHILQLRSNIVDGLTNLISLYGDVLVSCRAVAVLIIKLLQRRIGKMQPISN
jgi:hypothetical protein